MTPRLFAVAATIIFNLSGNPAILAATNDGLLDLSAQATHESRAFQRYLYTVPFQEGNFTGFSGSVSISSVSDTFSEALFSVGFIPGGECPPSGHFQRRGQIWELYPQAQRLLNIIVKNSGKGAVSVPTNFTQPRPIPIGGCVYLTMDGSNLTGGSFTMTSDMTLHFNTDPPPSPAPYFPHMGGSEFCFGQDHGCVRATAIPSERRAFAQIYRAKKPVSVLALMGNISDGTGYPLVPAVGNWSVTHDFYIYKGGCPQFPAAQGIVFGPDDYYASIPSDAEHLLHVVMRGKGITVAQQPIYKDFSGITMQKGDCLVNLSKSNGHQGGIDSETQVFPLLQDLPAR